MPRFPRLASCAVALFLCVTLAEPIATAHIPADLPIGERIARHARDQIGRTFLYDSRYVEISYPGGDIPLFRGVCTDVAIRALRGAGLDLQKLVHEDMRRNFGAYPGTWGLKHPDPNIDHRRVPNIVTFFKRRNASLPLPVDIQNTRAGDLIAWQMPGGAPHIGVVSRVKKGTVWIVHNNGLGAREETVLNKWPVSAHLRPAP